MQPVFCFFNTTPTWGGGEKWHFEFSQYLLNKGYKVVFILSPNSELDKRTEGISGYNVYKFSVNQFSFFNLQKRNKISRILKQEGITHLLINSSEDLKTGGLAGKQAEIPYIIYRRGSSIPIKNSFSNRYLFSKVITHVIANSQATKKTILERNQNLFPKDKIEVIYNGIDIQGKPEGDDVYTKQNHEVVLGNAGRLSHEKGQQSLLEMAVILKRKGLNFKLLIAGTGKLENELNAFISENNLQAEVELVGFIDQIHTFMNAIDIFLMSSKWEGFGYVTAEASLNKKPVVAYQVGSNPEIVVDGKSGYVVPAFDLNAYSSRVEELIHSKEKREEMGAYGHQFVKDNFEKERQFSKTEEFLLSI